jgi:hypothetical protein
MFITYVPLLSEIFTPIIFQYNLHALIILIITPLQCNIKIRSNVKKTFIQITQSMEFDNV